MMASTATQVPKVSRTERRRVETRGRLVAAALKVIASKGSDSATVADITEEADVGLGTFYHHFESKDAILAAIVADIAEFVGAALDTATQALTDPAEVLSAAVRHIVRRVDSEPRWGWLLVRTMSLAEVPEAFMRRNRRDLLRGIDAGRFDVADVDVAQAAVCGSTIWMVQSRLAGRAPADADVHLAHHLLRMLGVADAEAAAIARRPLPELLGLGAAAPN